MEKFKEIKKIGDGSFGTVIKAQDIQTQELVAIKKLKQKYTSWEDCMNLRELKSLQKLKHINIVKLKEVIRQNDEVSFVFEFIEQNLYQFQTSFKDQAKIMPEDEIRSIIHQCASALAYMHKHGFFHRDLKPENIGMTSDRVIKLLDFGLAREIRSRPPYTDYVATRWYRAPEIILKQTNYNSPVDIFALGCIMCELYLNRPIFSGNSEMDQFNKILSIQGTFTQTEWPEGHKLLTQMGISIAQFQQIPFNSIIPNASPDAINLISQMLRWNPNKRITASQILNHNFFPNSLNFLPKDLTKFPQNVKIESVLPSQSIQQQYEKKQQLENEEIEQFYQPSFEKRNQRQRQQQPKQNVESDYLNELLSNQPKQPVEKQKEEINLYSKKQKKKEEIDDIIDLIDQETGSISYQPSQFQPTPKKSQVRMSKPAQIESNNDFSDYGGYVPSQLTRNVGQKKEIVASSNSIYNFENVYQKPEQNLKMRNKQY